MYFDTGYILLLVAIAISGIAQSKVVSNYNKYARIPNKSGLTGREVAETILQRNGMVNVRVERSNAGTLSDHFDPRTKVIRLSEGIYDGRSIASSAIAAHEVGHAIQHHVGYSPLAIRSTLVPIANFGSRLTWILVLAGVVLSSNSLINFGIIAFSASLIFQLITLPVEFNASSRAKNQLSQGLIASDEEKGVSNMLSAAAMTYVASTLTGLAQLIRLLGLSRRSRR